MRSVLAVLAALVMGVLASCHGAAERAASFGQGPWYTRYALYQEKNVHRTSNYRRGFLVPINTRVTLLDVVKNQVRLKIDETGETLVIENVPKHTKGPVEQAVDRVLSPQPIDVSGFSAEEQQGIREGRAMPGMSRAAVLAAMGPPPESGTPNLDAMQWRYWDSVVTSFLVTFDAAGTVVNVGR
ncbi:MAG: hypothetical protein U1E73_02630 [Planctomycetota bacterium]